MDELFNEFNVPLQGPFGEPFRDPFADPLRDPLLDQLEAMENAIQPAPVPGQPRFADLAEGMDWMGYALGRLEDSVEAPPVSSTPGPAEPPIPAPAEAPPEDTGQRARPQPPLPPPPGLSWSPERRWGDLRAPIQATPYFTHEGLRPPSYHPLGGGGAGIRNTEELELTRWCAEVNQPVRQEDCQECDQWGDHGNGVSQCYHDWLAENEDKDGGKEQGHDGES